MKRIGDNYEKEWWNWNSMSKQQDVLAAALTDDFKPLREVLNQANADYTKITRHVRWEKLNAHRILELDHSTSTEIRIRRGPNWKPFWKSKGFDITNEEIWFMGLMETMKDIKIKF